MSQDLKLSSNEPIPTFPFIPPPSQEKDLVTLPPAQRKEELTVWPFHADR